MDGMLGNVLVTGGSGFIGSHVVAALAAAGYAPIVLDNFVNSSRAVVPRLRSIVGDTMRCIDGDVRDRALLKRVFAEHAIAAVVHCAGLKAVGESGAQPVAYYDNNVGGSITLFEAMAVAGVRTLVFSSSATVYGQPDVTPVPETAPLRPANVYGRTKRQVEQILEDLAAAEPGWRIALLRYFNPGGAHPSALIGEAPSGSPNNLLPLLCEVCAGTRDILHVYGNDWPTADGTGVRDYIHVMDLAEGHVAAIAHLARTPGLIAVNLGVGRGYSVLEMIAAFERASGRTIARRMAPRRDGDIAICYADVARARKVLGWQASRRLEAICTDAWRWQLAREQA
jgi:UDP-glucose 4-epimerase